MKHIVALSGGKDSTALALRLAEIGGREYEYICTPTGNELPDMIRHWGTLECLLRKKLKKIGCGMSLYDVIEQAKMIPNHRARFCTRILKIEPAIEYMKSLSERSIMYVGLRADEEERKGIFGEEIEVKFPLREWGWGIGDVFAYLEEKKINIPRRTDCAVCFHQRLGEWWDLWRDYPDLFDEAVELENKYEHTFRSEDRDTWPASLEGLKSRFERGEIPSGLSINYTLFGNDGPCRVYRL